MGFSGFWNEKRYEALDVEKGEVDYSEYPEESESQGVEHSEKSDCKEETDATTPEYKFKDRLIYLACSVWNGLISILFWATWGFLRDENTQRKEMRVLLKSQLEEDGKREETIKSIHEFWSGRLHSAQWGLALPIGLLLIFLFFCTRWVIRRDFCKQNRPAGTRAMEAFVYVYSIGMCALTVGLQLGCLNSIQEDIDHFISKGLW